MRSMAGALLDAVAIRRHYGPPMSEADERMVDWMVGIICPPDEEAHS